jgi:hypothetical protein
MGISAYFGEIRAHHPRRLRQMARRCGPWKCCKSTAGSADVSAALPRCTGRCRKHEPPGHGLGVSDFKRIDVLRLGWKDDILLGWTAQ